MILLVFDSVRMVDSSLVGSCVLYADSTPSICVSVVLESEFPSLLCVDAGLSRSRLIA